MPETPELPLDLIALQRAATAASRAAAEYAAGVEAERRSLFPEPDQAWERVRWPEEQSEHLEHLRVNTRQATVELYRHPAVEAALAAKGWRALQVQLLAAAREADEEPAPVAA